MEKAVEKMSEITLKQALVLLQEGRATGVGFKNAIFPKTKNTPQLAEVTDGWFELIEDDMNLKINSDAITLELWFMHYNQSNEFAINKRTIKTPERTVHQIKMEVEISFKDIEYIHSNQKRLWVKENIE